MASHPPDAPTLIVGAGPVGLILALALRRHGCHVRIIDQRPEPSRHSKAMTLQPRSLELLALLGVAEPMVAAGVRVARASMYSGRRRLVRLDYGRLPGPFPFILQLPQREIERLLIAALAEQGVAVERGVILRGLAQEPAGVAATVEDAAGGLSQIAAPYLIGCDGANSTVLGLLGLGSAPAAYEANFIMADVGIDDFPLPADERHTFLSPGRYTVFLPIGGGQFRLITLRPPDAPNLNEPPTLAEFAALLEESRGPRVTLGAAEWLTQFQPRRRLAAAFRSGRVFLAGDAAHIHSPVGAQGLNTGLQDAINIGWKLGQVLTGAVRGSAAETLLDSYEAERLPAARAAIKQTDGLYRQITAAGWWDGLLARNRWYLCRLPWRHREQLAATAQFQVAYPPLPGATAGDDERHFHNPPRLGGRAPDFGAGNERRRERGGFLAGLDGQRYHLVVFGAAPADLAELAARIERRYPGQVALHAIGAADRSAGPTARHWADPDGSIRRRYGVRERGLCLIRPDGHIACRLPLAPELLDRYLASVLSPRD